jgi:hypothetical protein
MLPPNSHYSQMNFAAARQFSSRLLASILLQLQDTRFGLFVDKTRGLGFVVRAGGDLGEALADLLQAHQSVEAFVEECEEAHQDSLLAQKERGERGFREGRLTTWDEVKRRNDL